jgi:hypothetical protein
MTRHTGPGASALSIHVALNHRTRYLSRFFRFGHTPGKVSVEGPARSREFPYTLDLRT